MGKCFAAGRRGRYEEKGGGKQVGSFFESSTDNEKIKAAYGNYNFWSWLRYWWIDTENQVQLMLIDKGYYDYDYDEPKHRQAWQYREKNEDQVASQARQFGFGNIRRGIEEDKKSLTPDELQKIVMEDNKIQK